MTYLNSKKAPGLLTLAVILGISTSAQASGYHDDFSDDPYASLNFTLSNEDLLSAPTPSDINGAIRSTPKSVGDAVIEGINSIPGGSYITRATSWTAGWFGAESLTELVLTNMMKPVTMKPEDCPDTYKDYAQKIVTSNATNLVGFIPGLKKDDAKIIKKIIKIANKYDPEKGIEDTLYNEIMSQIPSGSKIAGMGAKEFVDRIVPGGEYITSATGYFAKTTTGKDTLTEALISNMSNVFKVDLLSYIYKEEN